MNQINQTYLDPDSPPSLYLEEYGKARTRMSLGVALRGYLKIFLGKRIQDVDEGMDEYLSTHDTRQVTADLISFYRQPGVIKLAPKTRVLYLGTMETYLRDTCGFELNSTQKRRRAKGVTEKTKAITHERELTRELIREILNSAEPRLRAEILIAESGGLRFNEVLTLKMSDVYLDEFPARVEIRPENSKNGEGRHTFITTEAVEAIKIYLAHRDDLLSRLEINRKRSGTVKKELDRTLLFPNGYMTEHAQFTKILKTLGYDKSDERSKRRDIRFHSFRKFFLTQAKRHANPSWVENWAGHKGYLDDAYHRPSLDEEREEYLKAEPYLLVNIPEDYIQNKIETADKLRQTQVTVLTMQNTMTELSKQIEYLKKENEELKMKSIVSSYGEKAAVESDNVTKLLHNAGSLDE